jgi:PhnB protein
MPVNPIPEGYHSVTPYLVGPRVSQLIDFLKQAFGATETGRHERPDGSIMHAEVRIGNSAVMMGEPNEQVKAMPTCLVLYVENVDETYRRALAAGAKSVREPADQFYGDRTGGVEDPSGNQWWLAARIEELTSDEVERRATELAGKRS